MKRMRLPNGFGQISKIKNRRVPIIEKIKDLVIVATNNVGINYF